LPSADLGVPEEPTILTFRQRLAALQSKEMSS